MPYVPPSQRDRWRGVWVVGETDGDSLSPVTAQLLGAGRALADALGEDLSLVLLGHDLSPAVAQAARYGPDAVIVADHPTLARYTTLRYTHVLSELVLQRRPNILLMGATARGRDLAPRVGARVETGITADALDLRIDDEGRFVQTNPGYGGNLLAYICTPDHRPQMATVRPNALPTPSPAPGAEPAVVDVSELAEACEDPVRVIASEVDTRACEVDLQQAKVVVAGGRGLKTADNFQRLYELAELMGAAVAASRPVVDEGWAPAYCQVGQTGITIQPDLYIAFGISGAVQHIAGVRGAATMIAVNTDPAAPIFSVADYGFVADAIAVMDELISLLRARQRVEG